ncbi:MAG: iron-sulfur cluster assembly accessory protein [Pseudomonadota bacterium]
MAKSILTITEKATHRIKHLLSKRKDAIGLKVGVKTGGCSGMSYVIDYTTEKNASDEVVQAQDIHIFIDAKAIMYLIGTEMDYEEGQFKEGFVFTNPNEKAKCGCGKSFEV